MLEFLELHPVIFSLVIFTARIMDVSLGTVRTILVFRGYRLLSAVIGFLEVLIWILAASQVLHHLNQWYLVLGYASGFATGNMVGIWLESKLAMGTEIIQIISEDATIPLAQKLRENQYHVTEILAKTENNAPVEIVLLVEKRRVTPKLLKLVQEIDPDAFYTVETVKGIYEGHRIKYRKERPQFWMNLLKRK